MIEALLLRQEVRHGDDQTWVVHTLGESLFPDLLGIKILARGVHLCDRSIFTFIPTGGFVLRTALGRGKLLLGSRRSGVRQFVPILVPRANHQLITPLPVESAHAPRWTTLGRR